MKKKREKRKGHILAWILSLAMVCSMASVPKIVKAENNVSLSVSTASETVIARADNTVEVRFDVPADYDTMAKLSSAGITKLEVTLKVTDYTQAASGTAGAQAFITGDISHHEGIDAAAQGMMIIDAGHYGLEHIFMDFMEGFLKEKLPDDIEIMKMAVKFPAVVV